MLFHLWAQELCNCQISFACVSLRLLHVHNMQGDRIKEHLIDTHWILNYIFDILH